MRHIRYNFAGHEKTRADYAHFDHRHVNRVSFDYSVPSFTVGGWEQIFFRLIVGEIGDRQRFCIVFDSLHRSVPTFNSSALALARDSREETG